MNGNNSIPTRPPNDTTGLRPMPPNLDPPILPFLLMAVPDDAPISKQVFNIIETVINVYIINGLSVIGSIGNILSIIILCIHGFKSTNNILLVSMAVADLLLVLTMPLRKISLIIGHFDIALGMAVEGFVVSYHFLTLNRVWSLISNTHVVIIAFERALAVYFPFRVRSWVTVRRMTVLVIMTHVVWYLALIPLFTMFDLQWNLHPKLNKTVAVPSITSFYKERELLFNHYNSYFINISVGAFLLFVTLFCCITISVKIWRMGKKRNFLSGGFSGNTKVYHEGQGENSGIEKSSVSKQTSVKSDFSVDREMQQRASPIDIKALKMLMAVCVTFLVLIFPTFLLAFFQGLYPKLRNPYWHNVNFVATSVSMLLILINSSINFILYIMFSSKFNRTFVDICSCKMMRKKK